MEHRLSCSCGSEWVIFTDNKKERERFIKDFWRKHKKCEVVVSEKVDKNTYKSKKV